VSDDHRSVVRRTPYPSSVSQPVVTPLSPSVVYRSVDADELDGHYEGRLTGYSYAREGHPNADVLAAKLAWLEGLTDSEPIGVVTSSGMAALSSVVLGLLRHGDRIVVGSQLYGRSLRLLGTDLARFGVETMMVDPGDRNAIAAAVDTSTTMVLVEVVSNPTLRVADVEALADRCRHHGALLVVDNTFTTPRMFRPFAHGADIVIHSVTKLLAGHADVTLGYAAARNPDLQASLGEAAVTWGLTPSPFDCWLAERGLHTFELRYDRAEQTAAALADALAQLDGVVRVLYPGRADHPDRDRADRLFGSRTGTVVSLELTGGRDDVNAFLRAAPSIAFAPTLGDVATTISHPASSSHRGVDPGERAQLGITEGLLRISVGIEDEELLIAELEEAVAAVASGAGSRISP